MDEVLQELKKINQRLNNLEEANQVTRDIIKHTELRFEERFDRLDAGQKDIHADIAGLC